MNRVKPISEYGEVMTISDWEECVLVHMFIDYDGYGHFADPDKNEMRADLDVYPSMLFTREYRKAKRIWTHIVWFNR